MSKNASHSYKFDLYETLVEPAVMFLLLTLAFACVGYLIGVIFGIAVQDTAGVVIFTIVLITASIASFWDAMRRPVDGGYDSFHPGAIASIIAATLLVMIPIGTFGLDPYGKGKFFGYEVLMAVCFGFMFGSAILISRNYEYRKKAIKEAKSQQLERGSGAEN